MNIIWLCVIIFFVRILDTTLSTIRTILVIRNRKVLSTIIAFVEVLIWFLAVKEAISNTKGGILVALSYSLGYAVGVYIGMFLTERLIKTNVSINLIINKNTNMLIKDLANNNFALSISKVRGKSKISNKNMIFIVTNSKRIKELQEIVSKYDKEAFMVVSENKKVYNGYIQN